MSKPSFTTFEPVSIEKWLEQNPHIDAEGSDECPDCDGGGFQECHECGALNECVTCDGEGFIRTATRLYFEQLERDAAALRKWTIAEELGSG
jgi:DnaJ-class molecular chaperone